MAATHSTGELSANSPADTPLGIRTAGPRRLPAVRMLRRPALAAADGVGPFPGSFGSAPVPLPGLPSPLPCVAFAETAAQRARRRAAGASRVEPPEAVGFL